MPGGIFSGGFGNIGDQGTNLGTSAAGATITAGGTAHTKGAYSQIVASTPNDASGFILTIGFLSNQSASYLFDVAIGASGSELILLSNIAVNMSFSSAGADSTVSMFVPCAIPAGSRLAARCQSGNVSVTGTVQVTLLDGNIADLASLAAPQSYGATAGGDNGTLVTASASTNTKGAWTQIVAATTYDIAALQIMFDGFHGSSANGSFLVDIGVGASGSEKVIIPNIAVGKDFVLSQAMPPLIRKKIPAGSRVASRSQASAASNNLGVSFLGYPQ